MLEIFFGYLFFFFFFFFFFVSDVTGTTMSHVWPILSNRILTYTGIKLALP